MPIDADGKIGKNDISRSVYVHTEISDGKGNINNSNSSIEGTVEFASISTTQQKVSNAAAVEKGKLGHSPLEDKATNINLGVSIGAATVVVVGTAGTSLGVSLVAGGVGGVVADKTIPKVTAEQVNTQLYYKEEVLK